MKIRMKGNSLRLRLSKSEVELFGQTGELCQQVNFGASQLKYQLVQSEHQQNLSAVFTYGTVSVFMPTVLANKWVQTNLVGLQHNVDIGNGEKLLLLIEKDFKCLQERANEDDSDAFPNPLAM